jgi:hypothetical protein
VGDMADDAIEQGLNEYLSPDYDLEREVNYQPKGKRRKASMAKATAAPAKAAGKKSTAIVKWDEEMAKYASQSAAIADSIGTGGKFISFKGGKITFDGGEVPGAKMNCVILDHVLENAFYTGKYDSKNPASPVCFAFGVDQKEMAPHEDSSDPQHETCKGCEQNEWGTADTGKGKACKNIVRLALVAESDLEDLENAELAYARVPVTSTKSWAGYVKQLESTLHLPPFAVVTELSVVEDDGDQFHIVFKLSEKIDPEHGEALIAKHEAAHEAIDFPYQAAEEKPEAAAKKAAGPAKKRKF